jgi:hypothetical protein
MLLLLLLRYILFFDIAVFVGALHAATPACESV